ncbi:HAD family hydrolase [Rathayibacter rathayi]|uniref:HAD family hydrolase n=1 Tax=Rathayibacter rathayi TaxID=33887 RepID=UPI000CE82A4E|nr:HAD family hydrolase [Rathayibacter rathayi]PPG14406.1 HAD family hydrolase [Rathayibacter rathayi]
MSAALFADLDGTTIFSARHALDRPDQFTGLTVVETFRDAPLSFMTGGALQDLAALSDDLEFVPTTTRTRDQFDRVRLSGVRSRYAIIANGGRILENEVEDPAWTAQVTSRLTDCTPVDELKSQVRAIVDGAGWLRSLRQIEDLFLYLEAAPGSTVPELVVDRLRELADAGEVTFSRQGGKVYLIPNAVTKEAAAAEIASRLGGCVTFASGDSALDLGMMRWADFAIHPAHGELATEEHGISRTLHSGVDAGEDIVAFVRTRLSAGRF